jgi:hypothetical protein
MPSSDSQAMVYNKVMFTLAIFLLFLILGGMTFFTLGLSALGGGPHGADAVVFDVLASLTLATFIFWLIALFRPTPVRHEVVSPEQLIKSERRQKRTRIIVISAIVFVFSLYALVFGGLKFFLG